MSARAQAIAWWLTVTIAGAICVGLIGLDAYSTLNGIPHGQHSHYIVASGGIVLIAFMPRIVAAVKLALPVAAEAWKTWRGKSGGAP